MSGGERAHDCGTVRTVWRVPLKWKRSKKGNSCRKIILETKWHWEVLIPPSVSCPILATQWQENQCGPVRAKTLPLLLDFAAANQLHCMCGWKERRVQIQAQSSQHVILTNLQHERLPLNLLALFCIMCSLSPSIPSLLLLTLSLFLGDTKCFDSLVAF